MSSYALLGHTATNATAAGTLAAASDNSFGKATVNVKLTDSTTMVTLSATNTWTHAATGTYQLDAMIGYGYSSTLNGTQARAGLYNVTGGSFAVNSGGAIEIIGESGVAPDPNAGLGTAWIPVKGRYTVASTTDHYGIYMAGACSATTWFSTTYAQGNPANLVTNGTKPENFKLIRLIKE